MNNKLQQWVLQEMVEHLEDLEGQIVYGCDLAFKLFENENVTGSYTCSSYKANQWIKEYWDYLREVVEDYEFNYGELPVNPFDNAEVFQVQIILHMASSLVTESDYINKHWDVEIEFTSDIINIIAKEWYKAI